MKQTTFESLAWKHKGKVTRREQFLAEMDAVIPWKSLVGLIEPHYPKAGNGTQPMPLERMLRIHFMQHCRVSAPDQSAALASPGSMRAHLSRDQAPVGFHQGALPRSREKHFVPVHRARPGELVPAEATVDATVGDVSMKKAEIARLSERTPPNGAQWALHQPLLRGATNANTKDHPPVVYRATAPDRAICVSMHKGCCRGARRRCPRTSALERRRTLPSPRLAA